MCHFPFFHLQKGLSFKTPNQNQPRPSSQKKKKKKKPRPWLWYTILSITPIPHLI